MKNPNFNNEGYESLKVSEVENITKVEWENIKIFRVRHGDTLYKEQLGGLSEGVIDLTEKGIQQLEDAADKIAERLDKKTDVISIISSPRQRTKDSAGIIKRVLTERGFSVWEDPEARVEQDRIRSTDLFNSDDEVIHVSDPEYVEGWSKIATDMSQKLQPGETGVQLWKRGAIPSTEKAEDVSNRSRDQLTFLTRIARQIQPKLDKHIIIVQVEHEETMDDLLEFASEGKLGIAAGNGVEKGEVIELDIPVKGNDIVVTPISRGLEPTTVTVEFDHLKRKFRSKKHEIE